MKKAEEADLFDFFTSTRRLADLSRRLDAAAVFTIVEGAQFSLANHPDSWMVARVLPLARVKSGCLPEIGYGISLDEPVRSHPCKYRNTLLNPTFAAVGDELRLSERVPRTLPA